MLDEGTCKIRKLSQSTHLLRPRAPGIQVLVATFGFSVACAGQPSPLACPALDEKGKPAPLAPAAIWPRFKPSELAEPVPPDLARQAAAIVGFFEHGAGNPWTGVSGREELSVGFMQWNWRTGSLVTEFLRSVPDAVVQQAPDPVREGLAVLKRADRSNNSAHAQGVAVIADWRKATPVDPLLRNGFRRSVDGALRLWLATADVTAVQRVLVERDMRKAYAYARRWASERAGGGQEPQPNAQLLAYFFDLITFNGGTGGLWIAHANASMRQYPTAKDLVGAAAVWLRACVNFRSPLAVKTRRLYNTADASVNADLWQAAVTQDSSAFTDEQLALFALAWLRAQRSNGSDPPSAFPGVYQIDVMSRRGAIALGLGQVHGSRYPKK